MGLKIAVVGGGSTYTPELVEGFARRADRLPIDELVLLDIDPSGSRSSAGSPAGCSTRLDWPGRLVLHAATATRPSTAPTSCSSSSASAARPRGSCDETLPPRFGADRPGDHRRRRVREGAADGAGGPGDRRATAARAARPDAWIVDFTNPVGIVTQALLDAGHRAIGLCNVAIGFQRRLARTFGVDARAGRARARRAQPPVVERAVRVDGRRPPAGAARRPADDRR